MMRLLRVESSRFSSRRVTQVAVLGLLAVVAVAVVAVFYTYKPSTPAEIAQAKEWLAQSQDYWESDDGQAEMARCLEDQAEYVGGVPDDTWTCDDMLPRLENFLTPDRALGDVVERTVPGIGLAVAFFAFVVGVSFVAAEFTTGSMGAWLTFEPRRTRGDRNGAAGASRGRACRASGGRPDEDRVKRPLIAALPSPLSPARPAPSWPAP